MEMSETLHRVFNGLTFIMKLDLGVFVGEAQGVKQLTTPHLENLEGTYKERISLPCVTNSLSHLRYAEGNRWVNRSDFQIAFSQGIKLHNHSGALHTYLRVQAALKHGVETQIDHGMGCNKEIELGSTSSTIRKLSRHWNVEQHRFQSRHGLKF